MIRIFQTLKTSSIFDHLVMHITLLVLAEWIPSAKRIGMMSKHRLCLPSARSEKLWLQGPKEQVSLKFIICHSSDAVAWVDI